MADKTGDVISDYCLLFIKARRSFASDPLYPVIGPAL